MAVPKKKTSRSKRDMRRANHDRVAAPTIVNCPKCGELMVPHRVCPSCGHYKDREVVKKQTEAEPS